MNRFKFRVWDKRLNRYLGNNDPTQMLLENGNLAYLDDEGMKFYEVEFCTGLKDKNGKLIYEGDIVIKSDVSAIGYSRTRLCKTHWYNDWLSWAITTQYGDTYELSEFEPQQYEIIGNIHENADLLGE